MGESYYERNREKILQYQKDYRQRNKKKIKKYQKVYGQKNKKKLLEYAKDYRKKNREILCQKDKDYRTKNKEKWVDILRGWGYEVKCQKCGYEEHIEAIDFHHREEKDVLVGTILCKAPTLRRQQLLREELKKGEFLCVLCHRLLHAGINT